MLGVESAASSHESPLNVPVTASFQERAMRQEGHGLGTSGQLLGMLVLPLSGGTTLGILPA